MQRAGLRLTDCPCCDRGTDAKSDAIGSWHCLRSSCNQAWETTIRNRKTSGSWKRVPTALLSQEITRDVRKHTRAKKPLESSASAVVSCETVLQETGRSSIFGSMSSIDQNVKTTASTTWSTPQHQMRSMRSRIGRHAALQSQETIKPQQMYETTLLKKKHLLSRQRVSREPGRCFTLGSRLPPSGKAICSKHGS